jgi:CheY-like chemotaxis protein
MTASENTGMGYAAHPCPWPRRNAKFPTPSLRHAFQSTADYPAGEPARVLVDDSPANAEALAVALAFDGLDVRYALGGVDALRQLNPWWPHVFVLDINMPVHSGFAVARVLRRSTSTRDACVVAFTALGRDEFMALGRRTTLTATARREVPTFRF